MDCKELYVPIGHLKVMSGTKGFCLLLDPSDPENNVSLDTLYKIYGIADGVPIEIEEDGEPKLPIIGAGNFDVKYIRETRVKDIAKVEWERNYGWMTTKQLLEHDPSKSLDSAIKICYLTPVKHDLQSLRRQYRNPSRYGR